MLAQLVRARPGGLGELQAGEVAGAVLDGADSLEPYFARFLPQLALATVVPPVLLVWVALHDVTSAIVLACTVPLIPIFGILIGKATEHATMRRWRALSTLATHFVDVVRGLPTLRAYRRGAAQTDSIATYTDDYRRTTMSTLRIAFLSAFALELVASLGVGARRRRAGDPARARQHRPLAGVRDPRARSRAVRAAPRRVGAVPRERRRSCRGRQALRADRPRSPGGRNRSRARASGVLRLEGVGVSYPDRGRVLDGIELELQPGERVAIVGPSGAGKTTLLALLLGFVEADGGPRHRRRGRSRHDRSLRLAAPARVGAAAAAARAGQRRRRGAARLADRAQLRGDRGARGRRAHHSRFDADVQTLSAGEQRRVAFARALLRDAPLLLLDEPTAHLDERSAEQIVDVLEALPRTRTVLVATHDLRVLRAADRVLELRDGTARGREPAEAA